MRWLVLILGIFLSGCFVHYDGAAYQGPPPLLTTTLAQVDSMVGAQQPAAYKVGFMQGCDSGRVSAGENSYIFKKDVERFNTDDVYQQGWNDGYNRCFSGGGPAASSYTSSTYFGFGYFPFYYPGVFYSGYYPGYSYYPYYDPGYSIWLGYYGHDNHNYNRHYYASPWYGGHKYKGGGQHFSRWNSHKGPGGFFGGKHRGGGGKHFKGRSHGGGGGKHSKGRSHRGGGGGHKGH